MSYIGRSPQIGAYSKLDAITTDGSASYTMQLDSANFVPESVNHLIVSVNGVIQAPTDSFTVSGSTITFASSLSVSDTIDFIMALGNVLDIGVPSDSTVSLSKLTATGTKDSTTFLRGDNTFAVPSGGENTPAFLVKKSSNQTVSSTTTTLITWDNEVYDTNNAFDSNSFTVPSGHAGKYIIYCTINLQGGSADNYFMNQIMVNNTLTQYNIVRFVGSGGINNNIVASLDLSVGDYVTIKVLHNTGSNKDIDYNKLTWFGGFKLIGA